jgi:hypothetical protein
VEIDCNLRLGSLSAYLLRTPELLNPRRMTPLRIIPIVAALSFLTACESEVDSHFAGDFEDLGGPTYIAAADAIAAAANRGQPAPFDQMIDIRAMLANAFPDVEFTTDHIEQLSQVVPQELALGDSVCAWVRGGGNYQAIMLDVVDGRPAVLFRLIRSDGSLTYHNVIFAGTEESGPRIVDVYLFSRGEYVSATMARMLTQGGSGIADQLLERFGPTEVRVSPVRRALDSMRALAAGGDPAGALRYRAYQPPEIRNDKLLLLEQLAVAQSVGRRESQIAIRDMRRLHPDDVSLNLHLVDYYFLGKQYDSALAAIGRLDRAVDGDPYLGYMRASIYRLKKDTANMKLWANKSIQGDPSLPHAYWMLLDLSLIRRDYRTTRKLLAWLEKYARFDIDGLAIESDARYAGFVGSEHYSAWRRWREEWHGRVDAPPQLRGPSDDGLDDDLETPDLDATPGPRPGV